MDHVTFRERLRAADRILAPLILFIALYVASLFVLGWVRFPFDQWRGLISVSVATAAAMFLVERRPRSAGWKAADRPPGCRPSEAVAPPDDAVSHDLGLFVPPRLAVPEFLVGLLWGFTLIGACALLVVLTTDVHHPPGHGFPWRELFAVFLPAAVHEELLFRGYPFQKLYRWNRSFAIYFVALVFAALHAGNTAVTALGLLNVFLGGVLLGYAYERYQRLWFPIGLHLAWNVMSGPILGHEVSGYDAMATVLLEAGHGPAWLTGGEFGIEGSVWMTAVELGAIVILRIGRRTGRGVRHEA